MDGGKPVESLHHMRACVCACVWICAKVKASHWDQWGLNLSVRSRWACRCVFAATVECVQPCDPLPCVLFAPVPVRSLICLIWRELIGTDFSCVSVRLNVNNRMRAIHAVILTLCLWCASGTASLLVCAVICVCVCQCERDRVKQ